MFQVPALKVGVPHIDYKPFALGGEALGFEFPPDCGVYGEWCLSLSYLL